MVTARHLHSVFHYRTQVSGRTITLHPEHSVSGPLIDGKPYMRSNAATLSIR